MDQTVEGKALKEAADRARIKLLVGNLTTYGYALIGASVIHPLLNGPVAALSSLAGFGLGIAFHAGAWYIAPRGEMHG